MELCLETCPSEKTKLLATLVFQSEKYGDIYKDILNNVSANSINMELYLQPSTNISTKKWMITIDNEVELLKYV